jgi:hypothetical protein
MRNNFKQKSSLYSKIISERIAKYYKKNKLNEAFQSSDDSEFTMDYGPDVFSEEAMLDIPADEYMNDEEWDRFRNENYDVIENCRKDISDFWWREFVNNFNDFLYRLNRHSDEELTFDELIKDEWAGDEETVSLDYPEDADYYKELCAALQESASEAETATFKQFKNWLVDIGKAQRY